MSNSEELGSSHDYNPFTTGTMNKTYGEEAYQATKIFTISCYCISFIVGIIGNLLVIQISGFKMKNVGAVWFLNLAIADFIFCLSLPFRVIEWLAVSDFEKDRHYINDLPVYLSILNFIMMTMNSAVSVTFLTAISVDRCVSIMWPLWAKVHRTRRLVRIVSVFLWLVPMIAVFFINVFTFRYKSPFLAVLPLQYISDSYGINKYLDRSISMTISKIIFMFGIPLIIILICYGLIVFKLHYNKFKRRKAFQRTFRIIIAVVVCFFICWFPFSTWPVLAWLMGISETLPDFIISHVCLCLISVSSCINPILYVLLGQARGANYKKSIKARLENAMSESPEER
ncbi:C3a anaphylatoxin chemotactic receptor-like [Aquarana catesbeiana]|uniref:C3a anaphylatoxin chemotactic receptor-like n=1 Tax=Aquarana catesbeiana TaxID=8400 RepID=UPI003CC9C567